MTQWIDCLYKLPLFYTPPCPPGEFSDDEEINQSLISLKSSHYRFKMASLWLPSYNALPFRLSRRSGFKKRGEWRWLAWKRLVISALNSSAFLLSEARMDSYRASNSFHSFITCHKIGNNNKFKNIIYIKIFHGNYECGR